MLIHESEAAHKGCEANVGQAPSFRSAGTGNLKQAGSQAYPGFASSPELVPLLEFKLALLVERLVEFVALVLVDTLLIVSMKSRAEPRA